MNRKLALRVMVIEGVEMVPKLLRLSSTVDTSIMLTFSHYASFLVPTMWHFSW